MFKNVGEALSRLVGKESLSLDEIQEVLSRYASSIAPYQYSRVQAEIALHNVVSIREFDAASRRLTQRLIRLTWGLIVLTVMLAILTGALVHFTIKPKEAQHSAPARPAIGRAWW